MNEKSILLFSTWVGCSSWNFKRYELVLLSTNQAVSFDIYVGINTRVVLDMFLREDEIKG